MKDRKTVADFEKLLSAAEIEYARLFGDQFISSFAEIALQGVSVLFQQQAL